MSHTRHNQGDNHFTQHTDTPGLGHTSHFREGPPSSFKLEDVFKPLPVCLPEQAHKNPHYEEICQPNTIEPVVSVPDTGSTFALLALALLIVFLRPR